MTRAIVLFSGGLDSFLAVRTLQRQGIECVLLNIVTPFHDCSDVAFEQAEHLQAELRIHKVDAQRYLQLIAHPRWGYGKAVNPCIDCRILMCRIAGGLMEEVGADFVATGEIAGQRPNSQKQHQLQLIARESQLDGRLLRPLSAKKLPETLPEREDLVDRSRLHAFSGRGRAGLIRLALEWGARLVPQPSTGCLLCEKTYAPKLLDMLKYTLEPTLWDVDLLHTGRQLRLTPGLKAVVGRNREQCDRLVELYHRQDRRASLLLVPENFFGPVVLLAGPDIEPLEAEPEESATEKPAPVDFEATVRLAGALMLRFCPPEKYDPADAKARRHWRGTERVVSIVADPEVERFEVIVEKSRKPGT